MKAKVMRNGSGILPPEADKADAIGTLERITDAALDLIDHGIRPDRLVISPQLDCQLRRQWEALFPARKGRICTIRGMTVVRDQPLPPRVHFMILPEGMD